MVGLTAAQLARMRQTLTNMLPQSATLQTVTRTSDGMGGWTESLSTGTVVKCRLDPHSPTAAEALAGDMETVAVRYRLTVPYDAPLTAASRVTVDGHTYRVIQVDADHAWRLSRRALVVEVR